MHISLLHERHWYQRPSLVLQTVGRIEQYVTDNEWTWEKGSYWIKVSPCCMFQSSTALPTTLFLQLLAPPYTNLMQYNYRFEMSNKYNRVGVGSENKIKNFLLTLWPVDRYIPTMQGIKRFCKGAWFWTIIYPLIFVCHEEQKNRIIAHNYYAWSHTSNHNWVWGEGIHCT